MMSRMWIPYLALCLFFSPLGTAWAAEKQSVDVRLQPVTIKGKQEQVTTIIDLPSWAVILDAGSEPGSKTPQAGSDPDSKAPQAGQNPNGQMPQGGAEPRDQQPQWGTNPTDLLPRHGSLPAVERPDAGTPPIGKAPQVGRTPAVMTSPKSPTSLPGRFAEFGNDGKSAWQDKQADLVNIGVKSGRGILAGAIGAVALTLFAVGVMAFVGTTLSSALLPLLGVALSLGIPFGIGYSFAAGEAFRFWKGMIWGAIGAGIGMAMLYAGAGTVLRNGLQLLRGAIGRFVAHPFRTLRSTLTNKWAIWTFGSNMAWNSYVYWDDHGKLPRTAREWTRIVLGSLISTLVFDRFSRFVSVQKIKPLQKNVLQAISGMADTAVANLVMPKREHTASGYLAGLTANLTFQSSFFGKRLERMRKKRQIGTTVDELRLLGVIPRTMPTYKKRKGKTTNKMIDNLYRLSAEDSAKVLGYLRQQRGVISKNQMKLLQKNQVKYEQLLFREKGIELAEKYAVRKLDRAISWGSERMGLNNRLPGAEAQADKGERLR